MNKIDAYRTSDGKVFTLERDAKEHEDELILRNKVNEWVEDYCWGTMTKQDIVDIIMENLEELQDAIK